MAFQMAISPDVNVQYITEWFVFNTRIQRFTGQGFHATSYSDFSDLHEAYASGKVDLVFANAADTATLVRDHNFIPVAAPKDVFTEMSIVVATDSPLHDLADITAPLKVAATDAPDVERIGRILLEPTDLTPQDIQISVKPNPVLVAKALINGQAEAGFFPQEAFEELSSVVARQLRVLIASHIYVVRHSLLASPALAPHVDSLWQGLESMDSNPDDRELNESIGAPNGWERLSREEAEFMIDLMNALADI